MLAADTASTEGTMSSAVTRLILPRSRRATPAAAIAAVADDIRLMAVARSPAIGPGNPRSSSEAPKTVSAHAHSRYPASRVRRARRAQAARAASVAVDITTRSDGAGWGSDATASRLIALAAGCLSGPRDGLAPGRSLFTILTRHAGMAVNRRGRALDPVCGLRPHARAGRRGDG